MLTTLMSVLQEHTAGPAAAESSLQCNHTEVLW